MKLETVLVVRDVSGTPYILVMSTTASWLVSFPHAVRSDRYLIGLQKIFAEIISLKPDYEHRDYD